MKNNFVESPGFAKTAKENIDSILERMLRLFAMRKRIAPLAVFSTELRTPLWHRVFGACVFGFFCLGYGIGQVLLRFVRLVVTRLVVTR
jgi:hypothetical protein